MRASGAGTVIVESTVIVASYMLSSKLSHKWVHRNFCSFNLFNCIYGKGSINSWLCIPKSIARKSTKIKTGKFEEPTCWNWSLKPVLDVVDTKLAS